MHELFVWNIFVSLFCKKRNEDKTVIFRKTVWIFWNFSRPSPPMDHTQFFLDDRTKTHILTPSWPKIFKFQILLPPNEGRNDQTHQFQTSIWGSWFLILISQIFPLNTTNTKTDSYSRWVSSRTIYYSNFNLFQ